MKLLLISILFVSLSKELLVLNEEFFIISSFLLVFFFLFSSVSGLISAELSSKTLLIKQSYYSLYSLKYNFVVLLLQFYFFLVFWFSFVFFRIKLSILDINKARISYFSNSLSIILDEYVFFLLEYYLVKLFDSVSNVFIVFLNDYFIDLGIYSSSTFEKLDLLSDADVYNLNLQFFYNNRQKR